MNLENQTPFAELPEALVEEMLDKSEKVGEDLFNSFKEIRENKAEIRKRLFSKNIIKKDNDLGCPETPTTCGVDGSYIVERLLATDLVACAAVAIEGLTPPSEKKFWEKPHHEVLIHPEKHNLDNSTILRGLMIIMELELAAKAPHDIVFLDGSLTTPITAMNQAINKALELQEINLTQKLFKNFNAFIESYKAILESKRSDKLWVSVPKYTTRRELGKIANLPPQYEDRSILTNVLLPGEFTTPILLEKPEQPWHLKIPSDFRELEKIKEEILLAIDKLHLIYYKPYSWTPAIRIEISYSVASNISRIAILLQGLKYQFRTPAIMEPYPLYMADRIVKHLGSAIPAFRQTITKKIMDLYKGEIEDVYFNMHNYRTESGR